MPVGCAANSAVLATCISVEDCKDFLGCLGEGINDLWRGSRDQAQLLTTQWQLICNPNVSGHQREDQRMLARDAAAVLGEHVVGLRWWLLLMGLKP